MLIKNANIYTKNGEVIKNGYIYIEGQIIAQVGIMDDMLGISDDIIIDAKGMTAFPGFIDAHCHLGIIENGQGIVDSDLNEKIGNITPQLRVLDAINPCDRSFKDALKNGITSVVVSPGSANPIAGQLVAMKTYGHRIEDMIIKEPLAIKFALGEDPKKGVFTKSSTRMGVASEIREQLHKAKRYMNEISYSESEEGYSEPVFDFKCESLIPLLHKKIQAHFHAHRADDIFTAIRIAKEFSLDYVIIHGTEGYMIAEDLYREGCRIVAGPMIATRSKQEIKNLSKNNPSKLVKEGVEVAISTDYPITPIEYLTLSAAIAVNAGMDKIEALKSITINPAKICGLDDRIGSIEVGKDADIVLFEKDPLLLGSVPQIVIIDGKQVGVE